MSSENASAGTADAVESEANPSGEASPQVLRDRELLQTAQAEGKTLRAFVKLSGPGWLQSAITLGGGSLAGSLFLGVLGGTGLLWLQLVAIVMGVIMLSAISHVTLSTGRRPFEAINREINPALGWGWLIATAAANIIWCMPQFSLSYDALDKNLLATADGPGLGDADGTKWMVSAILLVAAGFVVLLNVRQGKAAKFFDLFLKALIGMVVICFFGVAILLFAKGQIDFGAVIAGLIPNLSQWTQPTGSMQAIIGGLPTDAAEYWQAQLVSNQRTVMIAAAATAVGINMTFLLPYSMLARGWDKPFRGLAKFDLSTGMAIPYIVVTSCVVIAAASSFHGKIDEKLASESLAEMQESPMYGGAEAILLKRIDNQLGDAAETTSSEEKLEMLAALPRDEKVLASALIKRNAFELSQTLAPLLGPDLAKWVFGLGVFGMGFSTIIILMLINGYAFREMMGQPDGTAPFVLGVLVAGFAGASWVVVWNSDAKVWLAIFASTFGAMLLPIAYVTFFLMMNSRRILGSDMPTGASRLVWNVLMGVSVAGAIVAAGTAIYDKANDPTAFPIVIGLLVIYTIAIVLGFVMRKPSDIASGV